MKSIFLLIIGICVGHLFVHGLKRDNLHEWIAAIVIFSAVTGYIYCVHGDFIKDLKKIKEWL